jgi:hypothetical protein
VEVEDPTHIHQREASGRALGEDLDELLLLQDAVVEQIPRLPQHQPSNLFHPSVATAVAMCMQQL